MKKYIHLFFFSAGLIATLLTGCDAKETVYSDATYTLFSDTIHNMPVTKESASTYYDIDIASTNATSFDRNYIIEVVHSKSNAIEGVHYDIIDQNVLIKKGERAAKFQIKAYPDKIDLKDSLSVTFRLVSSFNDSWDLYKSETQVNLIKCLPFDINDFVGDIKMSCTFPFSNDLTTFLLKSERKNDNTLIIKNPFSDLYDLTLKFTNDPEDPFNQDINVSEQPAFIDAVYGKVFVQSLSVAPCYYIISDKAIVLYLNMFLPQIGSFGSYYYILEWLSPEQADAMRNETGSPYFLREMNSVSNFSLNLKTYSAAN